MSLLNNWFARGKKQADVPPAEGKNEAESEQEVIKLQIETPTPPPAVGRPPAGEQVSEPAAPPVSDLDQIRRQLQEIERIIGEESPEKAETPKATRKESAAVQVVNIRAATLLSTIPAELLTAKASQIADNLRVELHITNLFDQLAGGKVEVSLREVASALPQGTISPGWEATRAGLSIPLPLAEVVAAIPPEELRKRMTLEEDERAKTPIPDLFRPQAMPTAETTVSAAEAVPGEELEPEEKVPEGAESPQKADVESPEPEKAVQATSTPPAEQPVQPGSMAAAEETAVPLEEAVAETPPVEETTEAAVVPAGTTAPPVQPGSEELPAAAEEPAAAVAEATEAPATQEAEAPLETMAAEPAPVPGRPEEEALEHPYLFVRGIDVNRATAVEIAGRIDGVGPELARRIVADREANGPFFDVLDLARVRGVGRRALQCILGRPVTVQMYRYVPEIRRILGDSRVPDVRSVADRLAELPGIEACVLAHREGYRVVATATSADGDKLAAFAPQIYKKLAWYIRQLDIGGLQSITLVVESRPITIVRGGELYLVLLHRTAQINRKQIYLAHALAAELSRRLQGSGAT
ncbi:MAG TPA: hypothetical protein EYP62_02325 [Kiritimatiellae bacterium]|nr:hypothetical protein [Kiritimatiellia bacterium]